MHERHRQTTATGFVCGISAASGTSIFRLTIYRRLAKRALYARRKTVRLSLSISHKTARLSWSRTHQEWGLIFFTQKSRFRTQSNSQWVFIWGGFWSFYHPFNVREIDHFRGRWIFVWHSSILGSQTPMNVFDEVVSPHRAARMRSLKPMWDFSEMLQVSFLETIMEGHIKVLIVLIIFWKKGTFIIWIGPRTLWNSVL